MNRNRYKNILYVGVLLIFFNGCSSVMEPSGFIACGEDCEVPSPSNRFTGKFVLRWDAKNDLSVASNIAQKYCSEFNGLKIQPHVYTRFTNYVRYQFQCNGYNSQAPTAQQVIQPQDQKPMQIISNTELKSLIEDAKTKCLELGFREKTEAFGKCVIKLTN